MTTAVPAELAAAVEEAFARPCVGGCVPQAAAEWALVSPCGHVTDFCHPCALTIAFSILRAVAQGSVHVCGTDGTAYPFADFRWTLTP